MQYTEIFIVIILPKLRLPDLKFLNYVKCHPGSFCLKFCIIIVNK